MRKTLAVLATAGAVAATALAAPAPAQARGIGPGLAFGLAAGALTAGAIAASRPYYGPGYGYYDYGPRYAYVPGPYAYYGGHTIIATITGVTTGKPQSIEEEEPGRHRLRAFLWALLAAARRATPRPRRGAPSSRPGSHSPRAPARTSLVST